MPYSEREDLKKEGHFLLGKCGTPTTFKEKLLGATLLLRAWYDRAVDSDIHSDRWEAPDAFKKWVEEYDLKGMFGYEPGLVDAIRADMSL